MTSSNGNIFARCWPFVRGIHRSPVNSPHKGQWRGALMFSLICVWIHGWVNNREACDLRRYPAHYDVAVMQKSGPIQCRLCVLIDKSMDSHSLTRGNLSHNDKDIVAATRRCSAYIFIHDLIAGWVTSVTPGWVMGKFIAYQAATYIRGLMLNAVNDSNVNVFHIS